MLDILNDINKLVKLNRKTTPKVISDRKNLSQEEKLSLVEKSNLDAEKAKEELKSELLKLTNNVLKSHGPIALSYLETTLAAFNISSFAMQSSISEPVMVVEKPAYAKFYNHSDYKKILPLCQLAQHVENNGMAEDHALKLSLIFSNNQDALEYLCEFNHFNQSRQLVHDACLFSLPSLDQCDFKQWQMLAKKELLNPRFRELLPHADQIEKIKNNKSSFAISKTKVSRQDIKRKKDELASINKKIKKINKDSENDQPAEAAQLLYQALISSQEERGKIRKELVQLCVDGSLPLKECDMVVLEAIYEQYQLESNGAHKILLDHGIQSDQIAAFYALDRKNADQMIPDIFLSGNSIGHSPFYIKKLDTLSDQGAALAACLGKITNCCQYLGGAGHDCAVNGITSPNSGFYVVCKGDSLAPSIEDPIVAQSWTWRSRDGALCFDSIEIKPNQDEAPIIDLYRFLAHELCQSQTNIDQINTGVSSGITDKISTRFMMQNEVTIDYFGYSDSKKQKLLAKQAYPYLFYNHESANTKLQSIIAADTKDFLLRLFNDSIALKDNDHLMAAIEFNLSENISGLSHLLNACAAETNRLDEYNRIVLPDQNFKEELDSKQPNYDLLCKEVENGANVNQVNSQGLNALHCALLSKNFDAMDKLIKLGIDLNAKDRSPDEATVLFRACEQLYREKNEAYRSLIMHLVEAGADVNEAPRGGQTALSLAIENHDVDLVSYLISRGVNLEHQIGTNGTALSLAAKLGDASIYQMLIKGGADKKTTNHYGNTPLMEAIIHRKKEFIMDQIDHLHIDLRQKNKIFATNQSLLEMATHDPDIFKILVSKLSSDEFFKLIKTIDDYGETIFHRLAKVKSKGFMLPFIKLSSEQQLEALAMKNKFNQSVLSKCIDYSTYSANFVNFISDQLPNLQWLDVINNVNDLSSLFSPNHNQLLEQPKFAEKLQSLIKSLEDFKSIINSYYIESNSVHKQFMVEQLHDKLPELVLLANRTMTGNEFSELWSSLKKYWPNMIHDASDYIDINAKLNQPQRDELFEMFKYRLPDMMAGFDQASIDLFELTPKQMEEISQVKTENYKTKSHHQLNLFAQPNSSQQKQANNQIKEKIHRPTT